MGNPSQTLNPCNNTACRDVTILLLLNFTVFLPSIHTTVETPIIPDSFLPFRRPEKALISDSGRPLKLWVLSLLPGGSVFIVGGQPWRMHDGFWDLTDGVSKGLPCKVEF